MHAGSTLVGPACMSVYNVDIYGDNVSKVPAVCAISAISTSAIMILSLEMLVFT